MTLGNLSIREKIVYGFALLLLLVIGTALLASTLMIQVERKVARVEVIDDFLNLTLELRRFEKNYFLYGHQRELDDAFSYWEKLNDLLQNQAADLRLVLTPSRLEEVETALLSYRSGLQQLQTPDGDGPASGSSKGSAQEAVRRHGKLLTDFAEQATREERTAIKNLLSTARVTIITSAALLVAISIVMAAILVHRTVSSLRLLEGYTRRIAQGDPLIEPPTQAMEEEINTLLRAFQRMHRELQTRQRQLIQSEKLAALGTLLAGVAHEINNPLSNISSSAQILLEELDEKAPGPGKTMLQQITAQTDKARDIVKTLLEFSRLKEFALEPLPLRTLVEETLRLIRGQVPSGVKISLEIPAELLVLADKQRIQQVFLNLIKNAVDALGEGGNIWLGAQRVEEADGAMIEIIVEDDGPGIEPEVLQKIFDPFFTTKEVGRGSGLGLFIVYDIVASHGGELTVDSRPGHGTTFVVWLKEG